MDGTPRLRRWLIVPVVVAALGVLGAGCGDDDDTGGTSTEDAADLDAVTEALVDAGEVQEVAACQADLLLQQVDEGELTQEELQAWLDGEAEVGPVQDAIVEIERSQVCADADADA